jgi:hypothetical protein
MTDQVTRAAEQAAKTANRLRCPVGYVVPQPVLRFMSLGLGLMEAYKAHYQTCQQMQNQQ